MKQLALASLVAGSLLAQSLTIQAPTAPIDAQALASVQISLAGAANVAGVQFDLSLPAGAVAWTAGAAATAASKQLTCAAVAGGQRCIVAGVNANAITNGVIAKAEVTFAPPSGPNASIVTTGVLGATAAGQAAALAAPTPAAITFLPSRCDPNVDWKMDAVDVLISVNQALGIQACATDLNGDGKCNLFDVLRIVNAALGQNCSTAP